MNDTITGIHKVYDFNQAVDKLLKNYNKIKKMNEIKVVETETDEPATGCDLISSQSDYNRLRTLISLFDDQDEFIIMKMYYFKEHLPDYYYESRKNDKINPTWEDVADAVGKSVKTVRSWRARFLSDMAVCLFGIPAALSLSESQIKH